MKKKLFVMRAALIVIALVVGAMAHIHIAAKKEVQSITGAMAHADKMEVTLYDTASGEKITVTDPSELEKISAALSNIQYKGPYISRNLIQPSDRACSVIVTTPGTHATMTLYPSGHDQSSYITGEPLDTALKNTDALYETIWSFFE